MSSTNNGLSNTVESLAEVFRCFICMEKLRDARLCPHCSKLCCYSCIRRWLTNQQQQCPHCRAVLHLADLVNCRWAEEVTTQLDTLKITETHEEKDKCELHKEKLTVYCSSCLKCICHQCALFNGSHAGHTFLPLDTVYKANMLVINEHLQQLQRQHGEYIRLMEEIERNMDMVKEGRDERFREIRNSLHAMHAKLEEQLQTKLDALNVQKSQISRETELIERALYDIEHRIIANGKAEVISKQKELLISIKSLCRRPMANFLSIPADFPSEVLPEYRSRTFLIKNFSVLRQNTDPIYSQPLDINGLTWRLKVYPDGNGSVRGTYLSIFLELTNGLNGSSKYEYRIEMIHRLSEDIRKNIIREFTSDFEVGECWGYNKFFPLNALISEGFLESNMLILRFHVRPPTYQQKARDQQWYIKQLESENEHLTNEIKNLRGKLESTVTAPLPTTSEVNHERTTVESDYIDTDVDIHGIDPLSSSTCSRQTSPGGLTDKDDSTVSLTTDEDFILADILERSAIEEDNQNQVNEYDPEPGEVCSYQSSLLNNLIYLDSQSCQTRTDQSTKSE